MKKKDALYAVIGGVVGTVLTTLLTSLTPIDAQKQEYHDITQFKHILCESISIGGGTADGIHTDISPNGITMIDEQLSMIQIDTNKHGGRVLVIGKGINGLFDTEGRRAHIGIDEYGGRITLYGKRSKDLKSLAGKADIGINQDGGEINIFSKYATQYPQIFMGVTPDGYGIQNIRQ